MSVGEKAEVANDRGCIGRNEEWMTLVFLLSVAGDKYTAGVSGRPGKVTEASSIVFGRQNIVCRCLSCVDNCIILLYHSYKLQFRNCIIIFILPVCSLLVVRSYLQAFHCDP